MRSTSPRYRLRTAAGTIALAASDPPFFHCADQKVLRRMGKVYKFQHLRLIAAALKQIRADCVRGKRRKALLNNSVARHQSQILRLDLSV